MKRLLFVAFASIVIAQLPLKAASPPSPPVVISEFLASNTKGLSNSFDRADWIEIQNVSSSAVNLENWSLTDASGNLSKWRFPATNLNAGAFMVIFAMSPAQRIPGAPLQTGFQLAADGEYLALVDPNGVIATEFSPVFPAQTADVSYGAGTLATNLTALASNATLRVRVPINGIDGTNWMLAGYDDSAWMAGTNGVGYSSATNTVVRNLTKTDVRVAMSNVNASAHIRMPFNIVDPANIALLTLRVRYDDGFAAFINGVPVVKANAPETLAFNSAATGSHAPGDIEEFRFGALMLQPGTNILAIHGLNLSAADSDFLVNADLIATTVSAPSTTPLYFTTPTPGAPNVGGVANPGPTISDVDQTPGAPLDADDILLTARIAPNFFAVSNVVMRYRVMFNNEVEVVMLDDGLHGDGAAGDGVYGATIPASASTTGQMVRWFFRATDVRGNVSRFPLFANAADSAEYLGAVVNPGYVTSQLPVFHIFAPETVLDSTPPTSQVGADGETGGRVAIFYDGEFYDNVLMELRGNTSAGQQKKSHRLEFNREHPFRHLPQFPRVRKTSFMAEFLDPAYIRQHLSFWLLEQMGVPSPFFYPVRAQLNGSFYALVFHNDVIDEEQVGRMGYDPAGALYKAVGNALPSESSTGVFQKKSPKPLTDHADYQAFVRAINETNFPPGQSTNLTQRRAAAYDMMDIPQIINHLAGARWCAENDDVWANMSIYRDTFGDGLWRCIPFDMNASWGQRYGGITPLDAIADNCKSHPLYGGSTIIACDGGSYNRIYDTIIALPETRQMLLRRQRTVLDRWVMEPGVAPEARLLESHIRHMTNIIWTEASLDRAKWGYSTWTASNKPLNVAMNELFNEFINLRRIHFSGTHSVTNTAKPIGITPTSNAGIPLSQPANAVIKIFSVEANPSSGNQLQEYICVTNPTPNALDISGWKISGAVDFTFRPGTILPTNLLLYVARDLNGFKTRTTGPRRGQGLFVIGGYKGQLSARGETIVVTDPNGRQVDSYTTPDAPSDAQKYLRVTEIMYNPSPLIGNTNDAQEFEYIEVKNISGSVTLDLAGVRFEGGIDFAFTGSAIASLAPGARALVVRNLNATTARYGAGLPLAGQYVGNLDNAGERIRLLDSVNEEILDFGYNNKWYPVTDGLGFSLVAADENAQPDDWDNKRQWRASGQVNGSPGNNDPAPPAFAPVVVNEVLSSSLFPQVDFIEFENSSASVADIGGWFISDDKFTPKKYRIPNGTIIPAGGFIAFDESQFNAGGTGFAFSSSSDEAWIFSGDGAGELTGYAQGVSFGAGEVGVSFGRYTNSVVKIDSVTNSPTDIRCTTNYTVHFVAQAAQTRGAANSLPKVGPIVISEIMYHPRDIGAIDNSADEFIELHNISTNTVPFYDPASPTNTWKVTEMVDYTFSQGQSIPAGKYLLVVNFDPSDVATLAAFRAKYGLATDVQVFGPYSGKLDNSGGRIELKKPGVATTNGTPYIIADEIEYSDVVPWPVAADGGGASLQRVDEFAYGNDPANWVGVGPSGGTSYVPGGTPPTITAQPASTSGVEGRSATLSVQVAGTAPFTYQWRFNGVFIEGADTAQLILNNLQTWQAGFYSVQIMNSAGSVDSAAAQVGVLLPPFISTQPASRSVFIKPDPKAANLPNGTNVTFTVAASSGNSGVSYQWQFNGVDLPGATLPSFTVSNVQVSDEGDYRCLVTDSVDTIASGIARLVPLISPTIVQRPADVVVAAGSDFSLSVAVTGNPREFAYSWRRNLGSLVVNTNSGNYGTNFITLNTTTASLNLTNNILSSNFVMRIVIYNDANRAPGATTTFNVTVLEDSDRDGIPDVVELGLGLDTNNVADASGDLDNDGMSNRAEYLAGTDPTNSLSYLRIEENIVSGLSAVQFAAISNRTYSVQFTDSLGTSPWVKLADVPARSTNFVVELPDLNWATNRYYRVVLPRQP